MTKKTERDDVRAIVSLILTFRGQKVVLDVELSRMPVSILTG